MLQGMTAHYLAHDTYPLKKGETALIHAAAGGVGLLLCRWHTRSAPASLRPFRPRESHTGKRGGAHETILYGDADFEAETKRLTSGKGVDVVYDSVGKNTSRRA